MLSVRCRKVAPRTSQVCLGSGQPAILHAHGAALPGGKAYCTPNETASDSGGQVPIDPFKRRSLKHRMSFR